MHHAIRRGLSKIGGSIGQRSLRGLREIVSQVELGHWLAMQGYVLPPSPLPVGRWRILDVAITASAGQRPLYLEFGVYQGASMRYVTEHIVNPNALFVGFDSFKGLPETWRFDIPIGHFSLEGRAPDLCDDRITLIKGCFDETLRSFTPPAHDQLIVNIDADVYSSARSALQFLEPLIHPGVLLYLDEFNDSNNELRAFREFVERTGHRFRVEAVSRCLSHWLFRCC